MPRLIGQPSSNLKLVQLMMLATRFQPPVTHQLMPVTAAAAIASASNEYYF